MKDYLSITTNNNAVAFPGTRAVDATGPLAVDGTEFIKEVLDDVWAEKQALLDFYNYPPNGLDDEAGVDAISGLPKSQPLAAQYMNYGTPGVIVNWGSAEDPFLIGVAHGIDIRLLLLQGQGIDRTEDDYKMLDSIVYVGFTENPTADSFYHALEPAGINRNHNGDYLILPDLRGYSLRYADPSGIIDPDGASRIVGDFQDDAFQDFQGEFYSKQKRTPNEQVLEVATLFGKAFVDILRGDIPTAANDEVESYSTPTQKYWDRILFQASGDNTARTSIETRVKNMIVNPAIHY